MSAGLLRAPGHQVLAPRARVAGAADAAGARLDQGETHAAVLTVAGFANTGPVIA